MYDKERMRQMALLQLKLSQRSSSDWILYFERLRKIENGEELA